MHMSSSVVILSLHYSWTIFTLFSIFCYTVITRWHTIVYQVHLRGFQCGHVFQRRGPCVAGAEVDLLVVLVVPAAASRCDAI
jgi:hypothetical protein